MEVWMEEVAGEWTGQIHYTYKPFRKRKGVEDSKSCTNISYCNHTNLPGKLEWDSNHERLQFQKTYVCYVNKIKRLKHYAICIKCNAWNLGWDNSLLIIKSSLSQSPVVLLDGWTSTAVYILTIRCTSVIIL